MFTRLSQEMNQTNWCQYTRVWNISPFFLEIISARRFLFFSANCFSLRASLKEIALFCARAFIYVVRSSKACGRKGNEVMRQKKDSASVAAAGGRGEAKVIYSRHPFPFFPRGGAEEKKRGERRKGKCVLLPRETPRKKAKQRYPVRSRAHISRKYLPTPEFALGESASSPCITWAKKCSFCFLQTLSDSSPRCSLCINHLCMDGGGGGGKRSNDTRKVLTEPPASFASLFLAPHHREDFSQKLCWSEH